MGNNHVQIIQFGVEGAITANATTYLYPGNGATTTNEPRIRIPWAGTLRHLYVYQRVASGAVGRTDIYTLRKNGVDQAITCTLNNSQTGQDTSNTVSVTTGDQISIKLVSNNAADTSADVAVSIVLQSDQ